MSTNKFFTWTKGVPDAKKRKPLPLEFGLSPGPKPGKFDRTNDSIALQDAAVASATSLLAVMNDCLNSHLLSTQRQSGGLKPMQGRPRSRTAPSTPAHEMPETTSPAELPGSVPPLKLAKKPRTVHQSMDSKSLHAVMSASSDETIYPGIRPHHSSPQGSPYALPAPPRQSHDSFVHTVSTFEPPNDVLPSAHTTGPYIQHMSPGEAFNTSDDTLVAADNDFFIGSPKRPSLNYLASWQHKSPSMSGSRAESRINITTVAPRSTTSSARKDSCVGSVDRPIEPEANFVDQIAAIRAAHEAHVNSLKETHDREIASYRHHIAILEKSRTSSQTPRPSSKQHLTIDTSHISGKGSGILSSDGSATTSLQSFESSLESQKRASSEAAAEAEALKRKLSLCRKAQSELDDVRRERDQLRDAIERSYRRIAQLKDIVRNANENEKAMKNAKRDLEVALLSANNVRIDVLEGYMEACGRMKLSEENEKRLIKERDELRNHLYFADPTWARQKSANPRTSHGQELRPPRPPTLRQHPLIQTLDELRRKLADKEKRIQELESRPSNNSNTNPSGKDEDAGDLERRLAAVQAERDRYNSLLHAEVRRQSRSAIHKVLVPTPQVEDEASAILAKRGMIATPSIGSSGITESKLGADSVEALQQELKHCIQEIIMYKLDIRGYKKDLRSASARIDALQTTASQPQKSPCGSKGQEEVAGHHQQQSGLGISGITRPPTTPQRNVPNATMPARTSATPTPEPPATAFSPPHRAVTPSGKHKRLPRPPSPSTISNPQSSPINQVQRNETLRSLSESIISSYANRGTPEQCTSMTPPPIRARSSDPPRPTVPPGTPDGPESKPIRDYGRMEAILQPTIGTNAEVTPV